METTWGHSGYFQCDMRGQLRPRKIEAGKIKIVFFSR